MRYSVIHVIELILGALLIGIGLLYLVSQQRSLTRLTDIITLQTIGDDNVYQQYNLITGWQVSDEEVCATIMGYREYPIMVDDKMVPLNGYDYGLYFTYIRDGYYKKEYQYEVNRQIVIILYTYMGM
jgi:hypothetical protein